MMHTKFTLLATLFAAVLTSCSSDIDIDDDVVTSEKMPVNIATRTTNNCFNVGDEMGLYMVNYVDGASQPMKPSGNHVDNRKFTYYASGWGASEPIYWNDEQTHADLYAYYPYDENIEDASAYSFAVQENQSTEAAYAKSDFMWCKVADQAPTTAHVQMKFSHRMSAILIKVVPGEGFTQDMLLSGTMSASIDGVKNQANVDLSTGTITATGELSAITPCKSEGCTYKAIVVPQTVAAGNLISLKLDGAVYQIETDKDVTFEMGKQYTFTVTLSKMGHGLSTDIAPWEYVYIYGNV